MKNVLHNTLKRLIEEGGEYNFLIINLGETYYIQVAGEYFSSRLLFEVVSNHYLPSDKKLDTSLQKKILELGWEAPQKEGNYTFRKSINSKEEHNDCIAFIEKTAKEIYGIDEIESAMIELNLE